MTEISKISAIIHEDVDAGPVDACPSIGMYVVCEPWQSKVALALEARALTEDEEEDALRGFPLPKRQREALNALAGGTAPKPDGMGIQTMAILLDRDWIVRAERLEDFGATLYALTDNGRAAVELDQIALESGYEYQSGSRYRTTYADLPARRKLFDSQ